MACERAGAMWSDVRWRVLLTLASAVVVIGSAGAGTAVADGDPIDDGIDEAAEVGDAASVTRGAATPAEPSVAVGLPPVPPTTTIVAVGLPPVPPTTSTAPAATAPSTSDHRVTALAAQVADLLVTVSAGVAGSAS